MLVPLHFHRASQSLPAMVYNSLGLYLVSGWRWQPATTHSSTIPSRYKTLMDALIVGSDKLPILDHLPDTFLMIDDGPLIDAVTIPARRKVTVFDPTIHSFNPLKGMTYARARDFIKILNAIFPEGESTLTRKNANFVLLEALLNTPKNLDTLIPAKSDVAYVDARQQIQTLLFSPVLKNVLTRPTNISFKGIVLAKLDRAALGEFDCFVLANLLISQYKSHVVIPDFGFYACAPHADLLRQSRLTAGINSFDEVTRFKQNLLLIDKKIPSHCTPEDAKTLAQYTGMMPNSNAYNAFIEICIGG